ncbi:MAG: helix-turn-helix domain-containing protein, partial [Spirochaetales bacterium]|nr:helix-turn-helix domain-containing protein [Spirochaetales bacterium]
KSIIHSIALWNNDYNEMIKNETCLSTLRKYINNSQSGTITITQDKLSNILGFTRESINKNLKKLESEGFIKLERSKISKL